MVPYLADTAEKVNINNKAKILKNRTFKYIFAISMSFSSIY